MATLVELSPAAGHFAAGRCAHARRILRKTSHLRGVTRANPRQSAMLGNNPDRGAFKAIRSRAAQSCGARSFGADSTSPSAPARGALLNMKPQGNKLRHYRYSALCHRCKRHPAVPAETLCTFCQACVAAGGNAPAVVRPRSAPAAVPLPGRPVDAIPVAPQQPRAGSSLAAGRWGRRPDDVASEASTRSPASIYASIKSRAHARAGIDGIRGAAVRMLEAAQRFYSRPSEALLKEFEDAEIAWSKFTDRPKEAYAPKLRFLLRERASFVLPEFNGNWQEGPNFGYIYALWSMQRPGWIKLGATGRHPTERQVELKKRHGLQHLEILFFYEIATPHKVEHEFHKRFGSRLRHLGKHDSREWFEFSPASAHNEVLRVMKFLAVRRLKMDCVNSKALVAGSTSTRPSFDASLGGRRALPDK